MTTCPKCGREGWPTEKWVRNKVGKKYRYQIYEHQTKPKVCYIKRIPEPSNTKHRLKSPEKTPLATKGYPRSNESKL